VIKKPSPNSACTKPSCSRQLALPTNFQAFKSWPLINALAWLFEEALLALGCPKSDGWLAVEQACMVQQIMLSAAMCHV
jgi:hypothetical protein